MDSPQRFDWRPVFAQGANQLGAAVGFNIDEFSTSFAIYDHFFLPFYFPFLNILLID